MSRVRTTAILGVTVSAVVGMVGAAVMVTSQATADGAATGERPAPVDLAVVNGRVLLLEDGRLRVQIPRGVTRGLRVFAAAGRGGPPVEAMAGRGSVAAVAQRGQLKVVAVRDLEVLGHARLFPAAALKVAVALDAVWAIRLFGDTATRYDWVSGARRSLHLPPRTVALSASGRTVWVLGGTSPNGWLVAIDAVRDRVVFTARLPGLPIGVSAAGPTAAVLLAGGRTVVATRTSGRFGVRTGPRGPRMTDIVALSSRQLALASRSGLHVGVWSLRGAATAVCDLAQPPRGLVWSGRSLLGAYGVPAVVGPVGGCTRVRP